MYNIRHDFQSLQMLKMFKIMFQVRFMDQAQ